ncbi:unnamed protein product [Acanthoscelides obtectus]|uniref:Uncharacterized protein n=1 Tax=Acanthoscelides obtectus TaxID=200917 RepID=A0A9P0L3D7_ACAOB|nr:unnamed protein product [Acanthoscelides obtectus]CAK1677965.1 hypothetical protein AOBTE_LOCUS31683 [Acanthoscelides obtectus]
MITFCGRKVFGHKRLLKKLWSDNTFRRHIHIKNHT